MCVSNGNEEKHFPKPNLKVTYLETNTITYIYIYNPNINSKMVRLFALWISLFKQDVTVRQFIGLVLRDKLKETQKKLVFQTRTSFECIEMGNHAMFMDFHQFRDRGTCIMFQQF